jgi:hypothetical protein
VSSLNPETLSLLELLVPAVHDVVRLPSTVTCTPQNVALYSCHRREAIRNVGRGKHGLCAALLLAAFVTL